MNPQFDWRDMLRFDKMIAPTFLTILYYIHIGISSLFWLLAIIEGMSSNSYSSMFGMGGGALVMAGLVGLVLSPFLIRLGYEILIVIFKIHSRLSSIDHTLRAPAGESGSQNPPPVTPPPPAPAPGGLPSDLPAFVQFTDATIAPVRQAPQPPAAGHDDLGIRDFWSPDAPQSIPGAAAPGATAPGATAPGTSVPPLNVQELKSKIPNWPAAVAALVVLFTVIMPYAETGLNVPILGNLLGKSYSIKDNSFGMIAVFGAVGMLIATVGGTKWNIFIGGYAVTFIGAIVALVGQGSVFSDIRSVKSGLAQAGAGINSALGQFIPQADRISNQMAANTPDASQFLTFTFYLFIMGMVFLGYWAFAGKYRERGLLQTAA